LLKGSRVLLQLLHCSARRNLSVSGRPLPRATLYGAPFGGARLYKRAKQRYRACLCPVGESAGGLGRAGQLWGGAAGAGAHAAAAFVRVQILTTLVNI